MSNLANARMRVVGLWHLLTLHTRPAGTPPPPAAASVPRNSNLAWPKRRKRAASPTPSLLHPPPRTSSSRPTASRPPPPRHHVHPCARPASRLAAAPLLADDNAVHTSAAHGCQAIICSPRALRASGRAVARRTLPPRLAPAVGLFIIGFLGFDLRNSLARHALRKECQR